MSRLFALFLVLFALDAAAYDPTGAYYPADPAEGEQVLFQSTVCAGSGPIWMDSASASVEHGKLSFAMSFASVDFAVPFCTSGYVASPALPAGRLQVEYSLDWSQTIAHGSLDDLDVRALEEVAPRYRKLSGNWFDPATSGTGVNFVQNANSGRLFAAWLAYNVTPGYAPPGEAGWLVMPGGRWLTSTRWRGLLYQTKARGANFPWDSKQFSIYPIGYITLEFETADAVKFDATLIHPTAGQFSVSSNLRRFLF
jgi:hypothetical protein